MEKLIVLSEDGVSQEFPLTEQRVSIGRDEHNIICLGDKSVSRHHATVQRVFRGFIIQDEGSTNGTRVNGRPITKQFLKHSDLIEIGKYHLRFLESSALAQRMDDADKTTVIRPTRQSELSAPPQEPAPVEVPASATAPEKPAAVRVPVSKTAPEKPAAVREPASAPQSRVAGRIETRSLESGDKSAVVDETVPPTVDEENAKICFLEGERKGEEVMVDRAFFSVGNPGGDLVLINKRHSGYFLVKVGGDTPPRLNGTPIKAGGVELHDGDRIELGELSLEFRI